MSKTQDIIKINTIVNTLLEKEKINDELKKIVMVAVDMIIDYYESRVCINCKHYKILDELTQDELVNMNKLNLDPVNYGKCGLISLYTSKYFGCVLFQPINDEINNDDNNKGTSDDTIQE